MPEFFEYVLWQLKNSFAWVAVICVLALAALIILKKICKGKLTAARMLLWLAFFGYLAVLLYATVLRHTGGYREYNFHLFRAWREAWNNFSPRNWGNVLLNVALFVPLGFFLPLLFKAGRKWYVTVPAGFALSALIEAVQLALSRGICDVDDLFCNGLGAVIGYFAVMTLLAFFPGKGNRLKPFLAYGCLTLVPLLAIGSIFAAYQLKEYGNFPGAPAYSVDLSHLEWNLDCELPDVTDKVSVYRVKTMNYEDCEAFAEKLAGQIGQEVEITSYYQEMAYYNLTRSVFKVYYFDGSYEFRGYDVPFESWETDDRRSVEQALTRFGIEVPAAADFYKDEDRYVFSCDRAVDGGVMHDGELRVSWEGENAHWDIENHLVTYTHYDDVAVISPMTAFHNVRMGKFYYADALKYDAVEKATVLSCTLDYEIDTKGFFRPVYVFEILLPENGYRYQAVISAMK